MDNLKKLYSNMLAENITSDVFPLTYNSRGFSCIFLIQDFGCTLFISTLGSASSTIAVELPKDFTAPRRLEYCDYVVIAEYLDFRGKTSKPFIPSLFFEEFDRHIPVKPSRTATQKEKCRAVGRTTLSKDGDKIFFCGWRNNGTNGNVTDENYSKTRRLIGEKQANLLRKANISSRWTNIESDEDLARINDYLSFI